MAAAADSLSIRRINGKIKVGRPFDEAQSNMALWGGGEQPVNEIVTAMVISFFFLTHALGA